MTNGDRIRNLSNEMLASVYYNLKETALYSESEDHRLLNDNPNDFLVWLNKETEDFEESIFDMRFKKITLCVYSDFCNDSIDIKIPFYKDEEFIKSLFLEAFGVEYNSDYCTWVLWS